MAVGQKWTDVGQAYAIDQMDVNTIDTTPTYFGHWGAGGTTPAVTDTALETPHPEARTTIAAGAQTQPATDTFRVVYAIVATGTRLVQETGVFDLSAAGELFIRIVHGALNLESGDTVTYTVNLRLKDDSEA